VLQVPGEAGVWLVGAVVSILTGCAFQPDWLPAASRTRVWIVYWPSADAVNVPGAGAVVGVPPSICQVTSVTADCASAPVTLTFNGAVCQPLGMAVVSVGTSVSIRIAWSVQAETLPATSTARVRSRCAPSPEIATGEWLGPLWIGAPSRIHSTRCTPDVMSTALTSTLSGAPNQPVATVVASVGRTVSIHSGSERQPETLPESSTAWVWKSCWPWSLTVTVLPLGTLATAAPGPSRHSTSTAASSTSVPETTTS
jgi:hypothetical protein